MREDTDRMAEVTVAGIPCFADVTMYYEGCECRGQLGNIDSYQDIQAPEPEEVEFEIYDRKGYPAAWLGVKLEDDRVYEETERQVLDWIHEGDNDDY